MVFCFLAPRNFRLIPNNERARDRICLKEFLPQVDNFMSELMLIATAAVACLRCPKRVQWKWTQSAIVRQIVETY